MKIPQVSYVENAKLLEEEYRKAFKEVLAVLFQLQGLENAQQAYQEQRAVLQQIDVILRQLNEFNKEWVEAEVHEAFLLGMATASLSLGEAKTLVEAREGVQFSSISTQLVETLVNDTYNDLLQATNNTDRRVKNMVRQVVGETMRNAAIHSYGRNTIRKRINENLTKRAIQEKAEKDGFIGIVDRAGRKWSTSRYANMISTTKLHQAHNQGVRTSGLEHGIDTAIISTHNAEDECGQFEGMIISLNGLTEGLLTYDELWESNKIFHPNCKHKLHLVKLDAMPQAMKDLHNKRVQALKDPKMKKRIKPLSEIEKALEENTEE